MTERKKGWLSNLFNGGGRVPDLHSRRGLDPRNGRQLPHAVSRHCDLGGLSPKRADGGEFTQGGTFPAHVKPGDIHRLQKIVASEYHKWRKGHNSKVVSVQEAGDAERITVTVNMFGVAEVGAFIRCGKVCTVFPEDDD